MLSRRCEYALRALLYLALRASPTPLPAREVSTALGLPHAFLVKTMQILAGAGIVRAQPGTGGGLALARPAGAITLAEVVRAIDGPSLFEACILRLPGCGHLAPCPLHEAWVPLRDSVARMLEQATLGSLAEAAQARPLRLASPGAAKGES